MQAGQTVKLRIADKDDLTVLSALLQDATVLIGDMAHDPEKEQFLMVVARYLEDDEGRRRRLMGINIDGVTRIRRKGFSLKDKEDVLNLLALTSDSNAPPDNTIIEIVFSGTAIIRLECRQIKVYAADLGEGWQTVFNPRHDAT